MDNDFYLNELKEKREKSKKTIKKCAIVFVIISVIAALVASALVLNEIFHLKTGAVSGWFLLFVPIVAILAILGVWLVGAIVLLIVAIPYFKSNSEIKRIGNR
jgi:hypothetical protein